MRLTLVLTVLLLGIVGILGWYFIVVQQADEATAPNPVTLIDVEPAFLDSESATIPTPPSEIISKRGSFYVYNYNDTPSGAVALQLQFTEAGGYPVLNVAIDFNQDDTYEAYETANGIQEEWVLKNVPAYVLEGTSANYEIEIVDTRIYGQRELFAHARFTGEPVTNSWLTTAEDRAREMRFMVVPFELSKLLGREVLGDGPDIYRGIPPTNLAADTTDSKPSMGSLRHFDMGFVVPDLPQEPLMCAPTVATNNLLGLANAYAFTSLLPTSNELVAEFKTALLYGDDRREGVLARNFVPGIDSFMRQNGLPIVTSVIDTPRITDIEAALQNNGMIALELVFVDEVSDSIPTPAASHLVTVTGASIDEAGIAIVRGRDSVTPGGVESWYWNEPASAGGPTTLSYPRWNQGATFVNRMYVHSVVSLEAAIAAGILSPDAPGRTYAVEMLRIATGYFPRSQFTVMESGACGEPYYGLTQQAIGFRDTDSSELLYHGDGYERACGFGTLREVPTESVSISWQQQQVFAAAVRAQERQ